MKSLLWFLACTPQPPPWPPGAQRSRQDHPAVFALLEEDADAGWVQALAPPQRYLVQTSRWTSIVDVRLGWVRHLDRTGAALEGCHAIHQGQAIECALDLSFGPPVRFNAEGHTDNERFTPTWTR
ncbi:MAG: hypothetical protein AAFV53_01770 [Myxococcota bacterium]